jgi:dTDP-glucose 4,6-dehydratase
VDLLLDDPAYTVVGVSRSPERSSLARRYKLRKDLSKYRYHALDMNRDMGKILAMLDEEKPDAIVNFAAQSEVAPSWDQPEAYGTCVGRVTEESPLNPSTPYAASKAAADYLLKTYAKQYGFPLLTVRATNVYGARQQLFKIIPRSAIYVKLGRTIELHGGGRAVKSYIHIRDVSKGEKAILENGRIGELYHLSPDRGVAVREVVQTICNRLGTPFEKAARAVDERPGQDAAYVIDSTKARTELGWKSTIGLEEGLTDVVNWVNEYWPQIQTQTLEYKHAA